MADARASVYTLDSTMSLRFTWDLAKAAANLRKHGVSFMEASTVADPLSITISDPDR